MRARRLAALVVVVALAAACRGGPTEGEVTAALDGRGAGDLVVLRAVEGGFAPVEVRLAQAPDVAVYADGLAIARVGGGSFVARTLAEAELRDLVRRLLELRLSELPEHVEPTGPIVIADAPDTAITVDLGRGEHRVSAYALSIVDLGYPRALLDADRLLQDLASRVRSQGASWDPARGRLFAFPDQSAVPTRAWPPGLPVPDGVEHATPHAPGEVVLEGADAAAAAALLGAAQSAQWQLEDGRVLRVVWRPLLPHER